MIAFTPSNSHTPIFPALRGAPIKTLLFLFLCVLASFAAATPNPDLASRIKALKLTANLEVQGSKILAVGLIADFYEQRGYSLAFDDARIDDLMDRVNGMRAYGLNPDDYHREILDDLRDRAKPPTPEMRADLELLLMDALLRMAYHRAYGKVNPSTLNPNWNFERQGISPNPLRELTSAMESASPVSHFDALLPEPDFYRGLKSALARYRAYAQSGGWKEIESGPTLKPGMTDPRLTAVRLRLQATADLTKLAPADTAQFDDDLKRAVERFQRRNGLAADGIIGPATLAAMNIPVNKRIDQIRVNLERARWVQRDLPPNYVLVNIAGYRAYLVRGGKVTWSSKVQVGRTYRETPIFRDKIEYIVFNPTWTVPPGILRNDIIPAARKDPDIIRRRGLRVLNRDGTEVDPNAVDWSVDRFPFILRQDPGLDNALGRVKLMFPNEHLVYLHDTPSKDLFERPQRAASSGCIRVERPLELAELLLSGTKSWDRGRIDQIVASQQTTQVNLTKSIPVLILYWTAESFDATSVAFRDDVYRRDTPVLRALDGRFAFSPPKRPPDTKPPMNETAAVGWVVQVASLTNAGRAERLVEDLEEQGFSTFIMQSQLEGKMYHRVRLGPLATRSEARAMVDSVQMKTGYQGQALTQ